MFKRKQGSLCYNWLKRKTMEFLFEGAISVKACILSGKRKVNRVLVDKDKYDRNLSFILRQAENRGIQVQKVSRSEIDALASGSTHGGIVCYAEEREYVQPEDLKGRKFLAILEGIEDPFNFGYCLRSLMAAGCEGVLVNQRNWFESAGVIAKSSAGASEYMDVCPVEDWTAALSTLKEEYVILAAQRKDAIDLYDADLRRPLILAIGGEKRGLSNAVNNMADQNIFIPYANDFRNALNASSAVSVMAFEILRQNRGK